MHRALQYAAWAIGLWLDVRVISVQLRGSYREYPFVFAYVLSLLVSTVAEIGLQGASDEVRDFYYWVNEAVLDVLVFCVVIAFIDQAARYSRQKTIGRRWLILASILILAVSLAIHHSAKFNMKMTLISRDLNISAVILDVILWSLLVAARRPDRRLMLLSGGLGLQLTGAVMGEQLLQFSPSPSLKMTGTLLEVSTSLLGLYIWLLALQTQKKVGPEGPTRR
jgi:hypothetical protein